MADWKRKDEFGNPIIDMDGHIFQVLTEEEQKNPENRLYLWIEKYNEQWYVKFGATTKTIWERYNDAGTIHKQQIYCWNTILWDKDFTELLSLNFERDYSKEENDLYSVEAYKVFDYKDVEKFIAIVSYHVLTEGKELQKTIDSYYHKKQFKTREEQELFEIIFNKWLLAPNRKEKRFLMYAVCRFGKTATTLHTIIKKYGLKRILILSSKCDTESAWLTDYKKWDFTESYIFITKNNIKFNPELLDRENIIFWGSFQSTAKNYETLDENGNIINYDCEEEPWQEQICNVNWDIIITDECHFGVDTPRSTKLINKLLEKDPILLEISATPFKKILRGDYTSDNTFSYTLIDEYLMHGKEPDYVKVELRHIDLYEYLNKIDLPKHKPLNKKELLYKLNSCITEDNKFSWPAYFEQFTTGDISSEWDALYNKHFKVNGKHVLVYVNRVTHGKKLELSLDKDKYNVINICGDNTVKLKTINNTLKTSEKPVIIISCGKFMTGVTIDLLTNVVFMGVVNSAEMYIQYGLRAKNKYPGRGNIPCTIYDLNRKTCLMTEAFERLCIAEAKTKKLTVNEVAKLYEEAIYMLEWNDSDILVPYKNFAIEFTTNFSHLANDAECPRFEIADDILLALEHDISDTTIEVSATMEITNEQLAAAKELNKMKNKKDNFDAFAKKTEAERLKEIEILRKQFQANIAYIASFMRFNNIENVNDVWTKTNRYKFMLWSKDGTDSIFLKKLSTLISQIDWKYLCENIIAVKNKLSENDLTWKYRGELPDWF